MRLEPCPQLRRDFEAVNKLIAWRYRVLLFQFLHDLRVAFGEDIERELAHRLRTRRRRVDARDEFQPSCIALCPCSARDYKSAQSNRHSEDVSFCHVKIVTELQKQKAELPQLVS